MPPLPAEEENLTKNEVASVTFGIMLLTCTVPLWEYNAYMLYVSIKQLLASSQFNSFPVVYTIQNSCKLI
uniref:Uncharacterized protein n=1 Tax=Arundo donax TaxID=35708 RepID=A0A0A9HE93_ARUDO